MELQQIVLRYRSLSESPRRLSTPDVIKVATPEGPDERRVDDDSQGPLKLERRMVRGQIRSREGRRRSLSDPESVDIQSQVARHPSDHRVLPSDFKPTENIHGLVDRSAVGK